MTRKARIVLAIGGATLTCQGRERIDLSGYTERLSGRPRLNGRQLLDALPEILDIADVSIDEANPHSFQTLADLRRLALHLEACLASSEVDGLVWVQGTNSLEETAFFLNLTVHSEKPLIVVGAQRPFTGISTDAHLNLIHAFRVSISPAARGKGVLVVANGEINAARDVTKSFTFQLQTFTSRGLGVLGYVDADRIVFYRAPIRRHTAQSAFDLTTIESLPYVEVLHVHAGANPKMARAAVGLGAKGLVINGSGAGSVEPFLSELLELTKQGVSVVRSSRAGEGRVLPEGNSHWPGLVAADNLNAQKSALLLALALTQTRDSATIQRMFDEY